MKASSVSEDEAQRLTAVQRLHLLDTPPEERFDRIARLAGAVLDMPIALITIVDAERVWWKSAFGLPGLREVPRAGSSCSAVVHLAESGAGLVVDPTKDRRFREHLLAVQHKIHFYAGQPLFSHGQPVGCLAVMDRRRRDFSPSQQRVLADLATFVEQELRGVGLRETLERLAAAERRAEEQHARFAAFMDHLPNVAFMKDSAGRLIYANRCHQESFGLDPKDVLGKRDNEWLPREVYLKTMRADLEVIETGQPNQTAEDIPTQAGVRNWLTFKFPIPTPGGERLLGGVAVDVTEQTQTERARQQLSAVQRAILDTTTFSIISTEVDGTIRTFNAGSERLLGYRAEEVVGRATPALFHDPEEVARHAAELSARLGRPIAAGAESIRWGVEQLPSLDQEWTFIRRDGTRFPAALSLTALRDAAGGVTGYVGVMHDITGRREAEAALLAGKETAEAANRAKSQFVANMSHEVRTPLNGILGVTAMLLEMDLKPDHRQLAEIILGSGQGLLAIVNDVLDFSKIEAGRIELEMIVFDLGQMLHSIVELNAARASERCLILESEVGINVPAHLHGDPLRLRQVLNNLVGNAIKFSDHGKITIAVSVEDSAEGESVLLFAVTDCGIGIPLARQANIFEPFTQAEVSTARQFGGTGLGLSICRQLVELMGGSIGVESELGQGARFFFIARFRIAAGPPVRAEEPPAEPAVPLPRLRVLLAEDSAINRLVATHQLQKAGCEIEAVEDGQQAVEALATTLFDLVLMDCQMPHLDGYEATREIRRREGNKRHTRIIALTANAMNGERERCLAVGMDGYLSKPFRAAELHAVLRQSTAQLAASQSVARLPGDSPLDPETLAELRQECDEAWPDLFAQYVHIFQEDAEQARVALAQAAAERALPELKQAAHRLRGSAANFGAGLLTHLCDQLEHADSEDPAEALPLVPPIVAELARVEAALLAQLEQAAAE